MEFSDFQDFLDSFPNVTFDTPFDQDTLVYRIGGKIFLLTSINNWEQNNASINIKATPEDVVNYIADFDFVNPGYHMNKKHWITVDISSAKNFSLISTWIKNSYHLVFKSLPKKDQVQLNSNNN